jgi:hypothetical protein
MALRPSRTRHPAKYLRLPPPDASTDASWWRLRAAGLRSIRHELLVVGQMVRWQSIIALALSANNNFSWVNISNHHVIAITTHETFSGSSMQQYL